MAKKRKSVTAPHARRSKHATTAAAKRKPSATARSKTSVSTTSSDRTTPGAPFVVAVLNSNQDVLRLIRSALEDEGYTVATEHIVSFKDGTANLAQFLFNHQPVVFVYDLAPPYKEKWTFLQLLRKIPEVAAISVVLTTVNKTALESLVGKTDAFEILGTRDNLAPLIEKSTGRFARAAEPHH